MRSWFAVGLAGLACLGIAGAALDEKHAHGKESKTAPAFEKLKSLAGAWDGTHGEGDQKSPVSVTYKVTAAGSVVVETLFVDTPHEMVTLYHMDGDDLVLTHYCAAQNQPRMKAAKSDGKSVRFEFVGATNLKSEKDMHMHSAKIDFVDADTIRSEWTAYNDGKADHVAKFELKRRKQ